LQYINDTIPLHNDKHKAQEHNAIYYFINGAQLEQEQYYADAIIEYMEALRLDTNATIYYALGKNYYYLNKYKRAEDYLMKAINYDSTMIAAMRKLGELYLHTFRRHDAQKTFEELVRIKPSVKNIKNLAYLYEFSDLEKAAKLYEKMRTNNEDSYLLLKLASIYQELKDTSLYIERLEEAYSYSKDSPETIIQLLSAYLENGRFTKARKLLLRSDQRILSPELEYLYLSLGSSLMQKRVRNYSDFKKSFIKLIDSRFYYNWRLQSMSGIIASQIDDTLATEVFFKRAMNAADSIPEISLQLANHYIISNNAKQALELLDEYSRKFPKDERFPNLQGMAYMMSDSIEKSILCYYRSITINKNDAVVYTQLGMAYDQLGIMDSSDFYYERALELDKFDPVSNNNYAYSLAERHKDLERAFTMSKRALEAVPDNSAYLDTYGWLLFQIGKYDEALEYIRRSIKVGGAGADVYLHLGIILLKKGNKTKAIDAWRSGLEIEPDNKDLLDKIHDIKK